MSEAMPLNTEGLTRLFGRKVALDGVTMEAAPGRVLGVVGENGAGKTTLMRLSLGLLRPHSGSVRVFGHDPVRSPEKALAQIGYLSEDHDIPGWMTVRELMGYQRAFYPKWDDDYAESLRERFQLEPNIRIRNLSRGGRAKAGLLIALAHRPPLLLLDEPSSGLDPVVRRDILGAIVRTVADEGRTVVFSSHLLDEVERVADDVVMIHQGKVVHAAPIDDIRAAHGKLTIAYDEPRPDAPQVPGALSCDGHGREWTIICDGQLDTVKQAIAETGGRVIEQGTPSLEEIFVARVTPHREE